MTGIREQLRCALRTAMKAREKELISAYRSALSSIDNAEAVPLDAERHNAGALESSARGLGAGEIERRALTEEDMRDVVAAEVAERRAAAGSMGHQNPGAAEAMTNTADALAELLGRG